MRIFMVAALFLGSLASHAGDYNYWYNNIYLQNEINKAQYQLRCLLHQQAIQAANNSLNAMQAHLNQMWALCNELSHQQVAYAQQQPADAPHNAAPAPQLFREVLPPIQEFYGSQSAEEIAAKSSMVTCTRIMNELNLLRSHNFTVYDDQIEVGERGIKVLIEAYGYKFMVTFKKDGQSYPTVPFDIQFFGEGMDESVKTLMAEAIFSEEAEWEITKSLVESIERIVKTVNEKIARH